MFEELWDPEWSHKDQFWLIADNLGKVLKANSFTREWFFMQTGTELVGWTYTPNQTTEFLGVEDGWEVYTGISSYTGARIEYRQKWHSGVSVVNINFECTCLDEELLQRRLEEVRQLNPGKRMFPDLV